MLDSKLIKKYSKLGVWSKILPVMFFVVMVIGAVVGYFLHNNNIYAQQTTDPLTVNFRLDAGGNFNDKFKAVKIGGKSYGNVSSIDVGDKSSLKAVKFVPQDILDIEITSVKCGDITFYPTNNVYDLSGLSSSSSSSIVVTLSINEYKTISFEPQDDLKTYIKTISFYESSGKTTEVEIDDDYTYQYRILMGKDLYIKFNIKEEYSNGKVTCKTYPTYNGSGDATENEGNSFDGEYYQCYLKEVQENTTVSVNIEVTQQVPVKLGTVNGKETTLPLGNFVSKINVNYTKMWWFFGWINGSSYEELMDVSLDEPTNDTHIDVVLGKSSCDRNHEIKITPRNENRFMVKSITVVYDNSSEEISLFEGQNSITVAIGKTKPKEIKVNLSGVDYKQYAYDFVNTNEDTKNIPEIFQSGSKVCSGPDVVEIGGKWQIVNNYAEIFLKDGYTVLKNSTGEYKSEDGTKTETSLLKGSGQEFIMEIQSDLADEGTISLHVVDENTIFEIDFATGTSYDLGEGLKSITVGGRETEKKLDDNSITHFGTNSSYVKDSPSSSLLKVKISFESGYTLNTLGENQEYNVDNIMSLITTSSDNSNKDFSATLNEVEEAEDETGGYACTFDLVITSKNDSAKLKKIDSKLALVLRTYTIKFTNDGKSYDSSIFSVSKAKESTPGEIEDSYETKKDYVRVSGSAITKDINTPIKVYFDVSLGSNYIDCKNALEYESGDESVTVNKDENGKLYFVIKENASENVTVKIKNIEPNKIYVPITIEQDDILEKYNMDVKATLLNPQGKSIKIGGKDYYCYSAVYDGTQDYQLSYSLSGKTNFIKWAQSQYVGTIFTNQFFDEYTKINGGETTADVMIKNLDSSKTEFVDTDDGEKVRAIKSTQVKGPDLEEVKVNFTLDSRYKEFLNFIKTIKQDNGTWTIDEPISWENTIGDQIIARVAIKYHILSSSDIDEFVGFEALGGFDLRTSVSEMIIQADEDNPENGVSASTEIDETKIDAFPEEKYKLIDLKFKGTELYENRKNEISEYNFRILNIKYPTHIARINVASNMAKFEITSGFLTDSWQTEDVGDGNQRLQATYNYNSNIAFTIQADSGYTISEVEKEIEIYTNENDHEKGENKVNYKYTEYQNEKNETVLGITLDNVKNDLYIYVELGPTHKTITHSKIEGANSYRIEKNDQGEYCCKEMILGRNTVPEGSSYYFMIEAQTGYNIDSLEVSSSDSGKLSEMSPQPTILYEQGSERSSKIKVYELKSVQKNQVISGTIVKEKCSVTFNLDKEYPEALSYKYEGQVLSGSKKIDVDYGENIEFSAQVSEKYNRSNYKIMLFEKGSEENGRELNLVNGVYTISNIITDKDVKIEGIEINRYSINLVKNDAAEYLNSSQSEIYGVQTVEYNGNYEFTLKANTGYTIGESTQVICTSEEGTKKTLTPDKSGKYKLSNVKEDFTINIMNVDDIYYTVTLIPVEGVTYVNDQDAVVSGSFQIKHGNNFEFGVNVDDAYDDSKAGMYIVINDGKSQNLRSQILYSGRYTINNITEDAEIKVGNIRKNTYTVTLNKVEGMDFYNDSNKIISGDNTVSHGDSLSFKVNLYPAYADSKVKIMLGTQELSVDESGFYTVKNVIENKIVTVNGVEETEESKFINTINNLPDNISSLSDVDDVISASRIYESFSDEQKAKVGNIDKLKRLQEQVKKFHHVSNDVTIEGVDWNIKLFAIPIDNSMEVYTRLYQKLNSEYILSLYNVYLWDTINDVKYTLPEGQSVVVSLPTPEMTYFEKPTGIHEKDSGKLDYLSLIVGSDQVSFTTDSFSPMGVVANRTSTPGRSSLLDTWDANIQAIKDYALSNTNSSGSRDENFASSSEYISDDDSSGENDGNTGNISEKFKSRNNPVTPRGSAIRLLLVLLILILLSIIIIIIIENMKKNKDVKK